MTFPRTVLLPLFVLMTGCSTRHSFSVSQANDLAAGFEMTDRGGAHVALQANDVVVIKPAEGMRFVDFGDDGSIEAISRDDHVKAPKATLRYEGPVRMSLEGDVLRVQGRDGWKQYAARTVDSVTVIDQKARAGRIAGIVIGSTLGAGAVAAAMTALVLALKDADQSGGMLDLGLDFSGGF